MRKINIRFRLSIAIGLMIFVFSFVTMVLTNINVRESMNKTEQTLINSINKFQTVIDDGFKKDNITKENNDISNGQEKTKVTRIDPELIANYRLVSAYGEAVDLINETFTEIIKEQTVLSLLLGLIGMILAYPISARLLKPFTELSSDIEMVTAENLNKHLRVDVKNDEIGRIKTSFNTMLDRLDTSFKREKSFSSNVAHELKTPLAVMKTNIGIIDEDSNIDEYKEFLDITKKNVNRMVTLVNDLCDFVKDENIKIEKVDMLDTIHKVLDGQNILIKEKGIIIHEVIDNKVINANQTMIDQLLFNLINNAIKYNKENGSIYITYKDNTLSIRDTGIGIPKDEIEHIFEPLYCVDKSRSRELGGSGLGLSIVKNICDLFNYKIDISSSVGYGTEFEIKM